MHLFLRQRQPLPRLHLLTRTLRTTPTLLRQPHEIPQKNPDPTPENLEKTMLDFNDALADPPAADTEAHRPAKTDRKLSSHHHPTSTYDPKKDKSKHWEIQHSVERKNRAVRKEEKRVASGLEAEDEFEVDPYVHRPPEMHDPEQIYVKGNQSLREKASFKAPSSSGDGTAAAGQVGVAGAATGAAGQTAR
ncbi:hypothetical protein HDV00_012649 [Rhizophlyctis rosea]|nr:hypothetical protein HDV00_012649 [Rhizophlyctis rosea]